VTKIQDPICLAMTNLDKVLIQIYARHSTLFSLPLVVSMNPMSICFDAVYLKSSNFCRRFLKKLGFKEDKY